MPFSLCSTPEEFQRRLNHGLYLTTVEEALTDHDKNLHSLVRRILLQKGHHISHASCALTNAESWYAQFEKDLLFTVWTGFILTHVVEKWLWYQTTSLWRLFLRSPCIELRRGFSACLCKVSYTKYAIRRYPSYIWPTPEVGLIYPTIEARKSLQRFESINVTQHIRLKPNTL